MQNPRAHYWQLLKLTYNALLKPERWYTGLSIKQYLRQKLFNLNGAQLANKPIAAGRWSAYAHYSMQSSFENLLEKHEIESTKTVLVHPLLPPELVDKLIERGAKIVTLDIAKNTQAIPAKDLLNFVRLMKATQMPDLVILYDVSGLLKDVTQAVAELRQLSVPTLVFVDSPYLSSELLELTEALELGSLIWNAGTSFLDEQLSEVVNQNLEPMSWYISWFIETRSRSVLEYHLRESQDVFRPLLEAYFYLLLKKYETYDWAGKLVYTQLGNRLFLKQSFESPKQAEKQLMDKYNDLQNRAIPDVVFDLQQKRTDSENPEINETLDDVHHREVFWRQKSKAVYEYLVGQINQRPQGSLEVADFFLDRSYVWQYFLTTDKPFWSAHFQDRGWLVDTSLNLHPLFLDKPNLPNANLAGRYGLGLNIPTGLEKNVF
jgi:hypothetical protein